MSVARWRGVSTLALLAGLCACAPAENAVVGSPAPPGVLSVTVISEVTIVAMRNPTETPSPTANALPEPTNTPVPAPPMRVCSPLEGYSLGELTELVSNPYAPPRTGSDDPHQGVDFAILEPVTHIALTGHPVLAALEGVVAGVIAERFPYGSALIVETSLERLPPAWQEALAIPTPAPLLLPHPVLTCPLPEGWSPDETPATRSLYLLYAHLESLPEAEPGQSIGCGDAIGGIGMSGNALNPHLHFEARIGPAGARFTSMAHYTASASAEEMFNYCWWRVSGAFQLVDPMEVFRLEE